MSRYIALGAVMFLVGACAWHIGETLSSDAISLALGIMFGTLAGLPVALLVLASNVGQEQRRRNREYADYLRQSDDDRPPYYPPQRPVIVITGDRPRPRLQAGTIPAYRDDDDQEVDATIWR